MSIQYKFRSAVNFETVEIGNRPSISIGELRNRIIRSVFKQQGFDDLLLYDAVSGQEYKDGATQIHTGSCLIIKRVPGGTVLPTVLPNPAVNHVAMKESHKYLNPVEFDQTNFKGNKKDQVTGLRLPKFNIFDLEKELRCSLCNNFFKDAVMIPCCQHSFCEKCICRVLEGKGMCPKCNSRKYCVGDLIPNLTLRRTISSLLEPLEDVPDRESGNQAKHVSRVLPVVQRELELPQSSSATGIGSNQVSTEPLYQHEADSNVERGGGFWIGSRGGGRNFLGLGGHKMGVRYCYTCGSPDHLMRDCPISHSNPMFHQGNGVLNGGMPGYAAAYWNGFYANLYSNTVVMPFNASLAPISPFAVPPFIPSAEDACRSPDWQAEGRHKYHHREPKKSGERRGN